MTAAFIPTPAEEEQLRAIAEGLAQVPPGGPLYLHLPGQAGTLELSPLVARLLRASVQELLAGHAVTLVPSEQDLSTVEAARLLGVSRPFLISHLLDTGELPYRMVGTHRRLALADVLAYRAERERRLALADELSRESQAMGLY